MVAKIWGKGVIERDTKMDDAVSHGTHRSFYTKLVDQLSSKQRPSKQDNITGQE
jgi:hypothetical protein